MGLFKAKDPADKAAAYTAKLDAKAAREKANFDARAKIRDAKDAFKAGRVKRPFWRGVFDRMRAVLAAVSGVIDNISTTTFILIADRGLMLALLAVIFVCFGLDIFFFGSKAPDWFLVPLFILIGFGLRMIAIAAGVKLESLKGQKDEKRARFVWRIIFNGCVIACMISAISFFVGGYQKKSSVESSITTVADASTGSVDAQINALREQQVAIRADRDTNIATLQRSIDGIVHDKSDKNDHEANPYRVDQAAEREAARISLSNIDTQITELIAHKGATATDAAQKSSEVAVAQSSTWAAFSWFSGRTGADERDVVDFGMLFFAILIEIIAAFGPGAYFSIRRKFKAAVRHMRAAEAEEEATLDAEIAQIEQRIELAKAMAAAARSAEIDDDEAALQKAKEIEADAVRSLEVAKAEARAAAIRAEIEALKNPPPPIIDPDEAMRQHMRDIGQKGRDAQKHAREAEKHVFCVPVDDWSARWTAGAQGAAA